MGALRDFPRPEPESEHPLERGQLVADRRRRGSRVLPLRDVSGDAVGGDGDGPRCAEVVEQVCEARLSPAQRASAVHAVVIAQHLSQTRDRGALHFDRDEMAKPQLRFAPGK